MMVVTSDLRTNASDADVLDALVDAIDGAPGVVPIAVSRQEISRTVDMSTIDTATWGFEYAVTFSRGSGNVAGLVVRGQKDAWQVDLASAVAIAQGEFRLAYDGGMTACMPYNAPSSIVQTEVSALVTGGVVVNDAEAPMGLFGSSWVIVANTSGASVDEELEVVTSGCAAAGSDFSTGELTVRRIARSTLNAAANVVSADVDTTVSVRRNAVGSRAGPGASTRLAGIAAATGAAGHSVVVAPSGRLGGVPPALILRSSASTSRQAVYPLPLSLAVVPAPQAAGSPRNVRV